jgi:hypothetical protein
MRNVQKLFSGFGLLYDALQQIDVPEERFATGWGEGACGQGLSVMKGFGHGNVARFLQSSNMDAQVAVGHAQGIPDFGKRELIRGGQQGHDGQTPFFMDDAIELKKSIGIHTSSGNFEL